ncbi:hypothetical protein BCR44DRAFT_1278524 [Catenaria anguillulae PL171]|uniref:Secreted protein n=1 Tax=Catenaria anguillulae PL171 TaxID=765915 RepID=A0A1Y2H9H5_9FUNG|nr:hypothetical protein BCR44DRAFT_1278524 [Catenaria anguillulae PL171]
MWCLALITFSQLLDLIKFVVRGSCSFFLAEARARQHHHSVVGSKRRASRRSNPNLRRVWMCKMQILCTKPTQHKTKT